ncbi:MAG TPA: hypothetical protein VMW08_14880 [Acidimicrobiales bacterium]|nr:hypothetical protein [Acidimicrobiales bacterium]
MSTDCELCEAAPITPWFHEDDICWIAECEACFVPMVVWREHGASPDEETLAHMLGQLERVATEQIGTDHRIDTMMRQIPDHFHAHARRPFRFPGGSRP